MTAPPTAPPVDYPAVLRQAVLAYRAGFQPGVSEVSPRDRPAPETVVTALLQAETAAKQQRLTYPAASLVGQWRLCFTTGVRKLRQGGIALGKGFYLPGWLSAGIGLTAEGSDLAIRNRAQWGGLQLKFMGPARYPGKKNLLVFDFTQLQVTLFDRTLYSGEVRGGKAKAATFEQLPISKLPFFSFFWVTDEMIAARGRGGGLALWIREG